MNDTICAVSTALGIGAISIIKVSGDKAIEIVNGLFKGKDLIKVNSHTINYGYIVDKEEPIDEVLITVMRSPKTATREDVVEINCHGGMAVTNKILELLLINGCRLAEPGEFTKRAYLNGRIDLTQAESVIDLITAKTELSRKIAINGTIGNVSKIINELKQFILEILANIEVNIDYPEYEDAIVITNKILEENINKIEIRLLEILEKSENNQLIKEGIKVGIIGRPNVGKSSLLNKLLDEDKAIVTDIEGTTRDIVEGIINLDGILLNIIDTAGIRKTTDIVEKIGVDKSLEIIDKSDLILLLLNNNEELLTEDIELIHKTANKNRLILINKIDLETKINKDNLGTEFIEISTEKEVGLDLLKQRIKDIFKLGKIDDKDLTYLSSARSIALLKKCLGIIKEIKFSIAGDVPVDIVEIDLKEIYDILSEIIGERYTDELVEQLFSQFCLGK